MTRGESLVRWRHRTGEQSEALAARHGESLGWTVLAQRARRAGRARPARDQARPTSATRGGGLDTLHHGSARRRERRPTQRRQAVLRCGGMLRPRDAARRHTASRTPVACRPRGRKRRAGDRAGRADELSAHQHSNSVDDSSSPSTQADAWWRQRDRKSTRTTAVGDPRLATTGSRTGWAAVAVC